MYEELAEYLNRWSKEPSTIPLKAIELFINNHPRYTQQDKALTYCLARARANDFDLVSDPDLRRLLGDSDMKQFVNLLTNSPEYREF